jgi:hypothetical protein
MTKYRIDGSSQYVDPDNMIYLSCDAVLNRNRCTRNDTLFMTKRSKRFFVLSRSMWQGEHDSMAEVSKDDAHAFIMQYEDIDEANRLISQYFEGYAGFEELD